MSNKTGKKLGRVVLAPFVLIALGIAYCEANKAYWDHRVKEMCEKDGGVTVFEKIYLTKYDKKNMRLRDVSHANQKDDYYSEFHSESIKYGSPEILKTIFLIYRSLDKKVIGRQVDYMRVGGDMPNGVSHPSSYNCDKAGISTEIEKLIFIVEEK